MAIRFRRTFKLFPGVKINIGKRGISTSVGIRGAHITFGKNGTYIGTGIPGTGISQRTKLSGPIHEQPLAVSDSPVQASEVTNSGKHYKLGVVFWLIFGTLILALFQNPLLLEFYWLFIAAFVLLRFVIREVHKKKVPNNNLTNQ
ncbi:MAG: DUF4236 domain-containing protein [bacterium]